MLGSLCGIIMIVTIRPVAMRILLGGTSTLTVAFNNPLNSMGAMWGGGLITSYSDIGVFNMVGFYSTGNFVNLTSRLLTNASPCLHLGKLVRCSGVDQ